MTRLSQLFQATALGLATHATTAHAISLRGGDDATTAHAISLRGGDEAKRAQLQAQLRNVIQVQQEAAAANALAELLQPAHPDKQPVYLDEAITLHAAAAAMNAQGYWNDVISGLLALERNPFFYGDHQVQGLMDAPKHVEEYERLQKEMREIPAESIGLVNVTDEIEQKPQEWSFEKQDELVEFLQRTNAPVYFLIRDGNTKKDAFWPALVRRLHPDAKGPNARKPCFAALWASGDGFQKKLNVEQNKKFPLAHGKKEWHVLVAKHVLDAFLSGTAFEGNGTASGGKVCEPTVRPAVYQQKPRSIIRAKASSSAAGGRNQATSTAPVRSRVGRVPVRYTETPGVPAGKWEDAAALRKAVREMLAPPKPAPLAHDNRGLESELSSEEPSDVDEPENVVPGSEQWGGRKRLRAVEPTEPDSDGTRSEASSQISPQVGRKRVSASPLTARQLGMSQNGKGAKEVNNGTSVVITETVH